MSRATGLFLAVAALGWALYGCSQAASKPAPTQDTPPPRAVRAAPLHGAPLSFFALNGTKAFHIPDEPETVRQRLAWMRQLAAAHQGGTAVMMDRSDIWWHVVEPEPGRFDFSRADWVYETLAEAGVLWYPILCYGAAWFEPGRTAPRSDEDFDAFARYVERTAGHFRGRVPYWSLWNEPNISEFWSPTPNADDYVQMMKLAYLALKRADPAAQLCAPAVAPLGRWDRAFVERMYQAGAAAYFDVFDYHYYRNHAPEAELPRELAEIRAVMRRYGDGDKPLWISESGVASTLGTGQQQYELQAALVVRNQLICKALGVERFFYFDLQNWFDDRPERWDSQLGLVTAAGEPKPSFHAYRRMVAEAGPPRTCIGYLPDLSEVAHGIVPGMIHGILLHDPRDESFSLAVWSTDDEPREFAVTAAADKSLTVVRGEDGWEMRSTPSREDYTFPWTATIDIGPEPVYVHGVAWQPYVAAGVRFDAAMVLIAPGESTPLGLHVDERLPVKIVEIARVDAPEGLAWNPEDGVLHCGPDIGPGDYSLAALLRLDARIDSRAARASLPSTLLVQCRVEVLPACRLELRTSSEAGRLIFTPVVERYVDLPTDGELRLVFARHGEDGEPADSTVLHTWPASVFRHEQRAVLPPFEVTAPADLPLPGRFVLELGAHRSRPVRIAPLWRLPLATLPRPQFPIVLAAAEQVFHSSRSWMVEDGAAIAVIALDGDVLLVVALIVDGDSLYAPASPGEMWRGDSLELFLGVCGPTERTVIRCECEFQIGLAGACGPSGEPAAFWFHEDRLLRETEITVEQRSSMTWHSFNAFVSLTELGIDVHRFEHGTLLAFDLNLNDRDAADWAPAGVNPGHRLAWNGGERNWIDPSGYGILVVMDELPLAPTQTDR